MSNGMRIDPKGLPLHMQEQVGVAIAASLAQATPVAGREEMPLRQKTHARRLRFRNIHAARRYLTLREEERNGEISDLVLHMNENYVIDRFTYCITEEY